MNSRNFRSRRVLREGFNAADQMQRYLRWYREGHLSSTGRCFDIGNTTRAALLRFERIGEPHAGSTNPQSAGNASIMRLAPVPLSHVGDSREAIKKSGLSSKTTHGAPTAVDACRYLGALIMGGAAMREERGAPLHPILSPRGLLGGAPASGRNRCRHQWVFQTPHPSGHQGDRVRGRLPVGCALGLPALQHLRGRVPHGRERGRRRGGHHRCRLWPARRGILRRTGDPGILAN